jgi:hypothetical protein
MMERACVHGEIGFEYDDEPIRKLMRAKRSLECEECLKSLEPGEKYYFHSGSIDGDWHESRVCVDCQSVIDNLFCDWYTGQVWDDLETHIDDCQGEISMTKISKLTPIARDKVCDLVQRWVDNVEDWD